MRRSRGLDLLSPCKVAQREQFPPVPLSVSVSWSKRYRLAGPGQPVESHPLPPVLRAPGGDACLGRLAAKHVRWGVAPRAPVQGMTRVAVARLGMKEDALTDDARWVAGIAWASQTHQACLIDAGGKIIDERAFAHGGAGLAELCNWLLATSGAEPAAIAVAIEVPHGPIVEVLLERGFQVYAINPKQLDRFRDRFTVAGAKDDRRDAYVLSDSLRTDRHYFRRLAAE